MFDEEPGPLFPGAFENDPAPSPSTCAAWFDAQSSTSAKDGSPYNPLVFAVAAVDQQDEPIRATRRAGRPPLAAYGFLVTTRDTMNDASDYPIAPLSGSSMAAAAVSGIAALVWGVRPDLSARRVMELIYESGVKPTSPGCSTCRFRNYSWLHASTPDPVALLEVALTPAMQAQSSTVKMRLTTTSDDGETSTAILPPADQSASFVVSVPSKTVVNTAVLTFQQDTANGTVETYEQILVQ